MFFSCCQTSQFVVKTWVLECGVGRTSQNMSQDACLIKGAELYLNISHCAMAHDCLVVCCGSYTASWQLPGAGLPIASWMKLLSLKEIRGNLQILAICMQNNCRVWRGFVFGLGCWADLGVYFEMLCLWCSAHAVEHLRSKEIRTCLKTLLWGLCFNHEIACT